jgi:RNA polymerase sigma-70 factor (ECF subfamily)
VALVRVDERDLVESHRAGDVDAFPEIVRMYADVLMRDAVRRLGDPAAAEDAVQETMMRAYGAIGRFNGDFRLGAWLHRILANVCIDEQRRRTRLASAADRLSAVIDITSPGADDIVVNEFSARRVRHALDELPPTYREALVLREVDELPYRAIAESAGVTEENARARVHRARAYLKALMASALAIVPGRSGSLRRLHRVFANTSQSVQPAVQATATDPTVLQLSAGVSNALPTKAVLVSGILTTLAASFGGPTLPPLTRAPARAVAVAAPARTALVGQASSNEAPPAAAATTPSSTQLKTTSASTATTPTTMGTKATTATTAPPPAGSTSPTTAAPYYPPSAAPVASPPPATYSDGRLSSDPLPLTDPSSCRIATSGQARLALSRTTLSGPLSIRGAVPCGGGVGNLSLLLTFTQSDGTLARVSISGRVIAETSDPGTRSFSFEGSFTSTGRTDSGVPPDGTATGHFVINEGAATATASLLLSPN